MTGLFHRLAQRVVGPEPSRVRIAAQLPFAAPPALAEWRSEPSTPAADDTVRDGRRANGEFVEQHGTAPAAPPPLLLTTAATTVAAAAPDRSGTEAPAAASDAASAGRDPPTDAAAMPRPLDASPAVAQGTVPRSAPGSALTREGSGGAGPVSPMVPKAPEPLLPHVAPPAAPEPPAAPVRHAERAAEAGPPEVHVHIGRIDVSSASEPQQRREPPRRRAEPRMSLEDYLARRKSGG